MMGAFANVITKLLELTPGEPAQALSRLHGDWALISIDERTGTVTAGRDPLGVRPLYYGVSETEKVFAMSSEVKALVGLPCVADTRVFPPGTMVAVGRARQVRLIHRYLPSCWGDIGRATLGGCRDCQRSAREGDEEESVALRDTTGLSL